MKNIHVLPTDKPSRLYLNTKEYIFEKEYSLSTDECQNKHIYITNDEEIKEGVDQWYLDKVLNEPYNSGGAQYSSKQDVIILTTDQDLIKDGIQAIDDEFLEWFVKNPSCESIEVEKVSVMNDRFKLGYKIIIPKEEPKQIKCYCGHTDYCDCGPLEEPKQKTLEEASWKFNPLKKLDGEFLRHAFKEGAKWQQERMYSEEEVIKILYQFHYDLVNSNFDTKEQWFEQFKNK